MSKRKMKRKAFKQRLNAAMQHVFEFDPQASQIVDPLFFSDDENEDNFFTDEEEIAGSSTADTPVLSLKRRVSLLLLVFGFQFFIGYLLAVDYKKQKKC